MIKIPLEIELIPKTCHYKNARQKLRPSQWNKLRKEIYEKAEHVCEICGRTGKEQGYKNNLECHEIWGYDDKTHTQKLRGLIALCPLCHEVKHLGRASMMGKQAKVFKQLEVINNWTHKQVVNYAGKCMIQCKIRSMFKWKLDITILYDEPYNIVFTRRKTKPRRRKHRR